MTKEMSSFGALLVHLLRVLLFLFCGSNFSKATDADFCSSRWCGRHNISYPFRPEDSPVHCGDPRYNLSCEDDQLFLYWKSGKFNVQSINYNNYTIRLVDANVALHTHDHSSLPPYSLASYNFSFYYLEPYRYGFSRQNSGDVILIKQMLYLRCPYNAVESSDLYVDDTATCMNGSYALGSTFYVNVGGKSPWDLGLGDSCRIEWMYPTSWPAENNRTNISCTDIHDMLLYGFELSWAISYCKHLYYRVELDDRNNLQCYSGSVVLSVHLVI